MQSSETLAECLVLLGALSGWRPPKPFASNMIQYSKCIEVIQSYSFVFSLFPYFSLESQFCTPLPGAGVSTSNRIHFPLIFSHDSHDTPSVLGTKHQGLIPLILVPPHLVRSRPWNYRTIMLLFSLSLRCLNMILLVRVARPRCHSKRRTF